MTAEEFEEKADNFGEFLKQLGYTRLETGRWIEELVDDGQGFPYIKYSCPFCQHEQQEETNYCPQCGARLNEE